MLDLTKHYTISSQAAIRPERFGGLVYRYDNRRLYFLHSPELVDFVSGLDGTQPLGSSLAAYLAAHHLPDQTQAVFINALTQLQKMEVLSEL